MIPKNPCSAISWPEVLNPNDPRASKPESKQLAFDVCHILSSSCHIMSKCPAQPAPPPKAGPSHEPGSEGTKVDEATAKCAAPFPVVFILLVLNAGNFRE